MLTDDEIDDISGSLLGGATDLVDVHQVRDLIAQAREANALRAQLAKATRVVEHMIGLDADVDKLAVLIDEHRNMAMALHETQEQLSETTNLQAAVTVMHSLVDQTDPFDPVGTALTAAGIAERPLIDVVPYEMLYSELVEAKQQIARLEENAVLMSEYRFAMEGIPTDGQGNPIKATNVPALISSMVVARVTTDEAGETTMEPATVDGEVKR